MAAKDVEAGRAWVVIALRDRMTQGLKVAEKRFQDFGRYVSTTAGVVAGGALGSMAWPLKLSADMEQASVSFEVFLGSAEAAKTMISDIESMAAKTPFQFDELKDSAQLLMGFGATAEQVLPMMQMLGDVSGGNSERFQRLSLAFGQVMAKGRLMGQEVMQMTEQGFNPLQYLSQLTGKSMRTLMDEMEQGKISFPQLVTAFQAATGPGGRFNGMMEKQSGTLTGLFSTMIDYGKIAARTLGDTLLPTIKAIISPAIDLAKGFTMIIKANSGLVAGIGKAMLIIGAIAGVLVGVGVAAMGLSFMAGVLASGIAAIGTVIGVVFSPLGALIAILIGLAEAGIYFRKELAEAFEGVLIWIEPVTSAFGRIMAAGKGAVQGVIDALSTGNIQAAGNIAITALKAMFWQAAAEIPGTGRLLSTGFGQALTAGRWDLVAAIAMARVKLVLSDYAAGLGAIWDMLVYGIRTGWNSASTAIGQGIVWAYGQVQTNIALMVTGFDVLVTAAKASALAIASFFTGSMTEAREEARKMGEELRARSIARLTSAANDQKGMQASVAQQGEFAQKGIRQDFETSRGRRATAGSELRSQISALKAEATRAAADAGLTTAADAAKNARSELDVALKQAEEAKAKQAGGKLPGTMVKGLKTATADLPKIESRGTFSAAAAAAFGSRTDATEQTARNTALSARFLKTIAAKRGPEFV